MGRLTEGQVEKLSDLRATVSAIDTLCRATLGVPMTGPLVLYPMCVEAPEPREKGESCATVSTLPLALRLAREVITAVEGLREKIAVVEAMVETKPEFSEP